MTQQKQQKTQKKSTSNKAANVAQDRSYSASGQGNGEVIEEETLDQITGGQASPNNTSGWKSIYPGMRISPDGKSFTYHGSVLPNNVVHLD